MNLDNQNEVKVGLEVQGNTESITQYQIPSNLPKECFRTYDIRGPVDADNLTPDLVNAIGKAIGSEAIERGQTEIIVGRDGRLSGPELTKALCLGLLSTGIDVIFIGEVPTPMVYFATNRLSTKSGVMVTASHNPGHHNGFKIVLDGKTLRADDIQALLTRIQNQRYIEGEMGTQTTQDIADDYIQYIVDRTKLQRPLKIVIDCGNGVAGHFAPKLYRDLGCEVVTLFCDVDGHFPNHHPDPTVPENLVDIINKVKETNADVGLAFDGDADRLGVITNKGDVIWPDRQMMLYVQDVLSRSPGAEIIFDVKCTSHLPAVIEKHGGRPVMWKTGHSVIKAKLFETKAPFAGEMSGHIFFNDDWFGFDDGLYVGARLLQILSKQTQSLDEIFAALPDSVNTPELKLPMAEDKKADFMQRFIEQGRFGECEKITIDGLRIEFADGWALVRPSNTSPYLILRFEADSEEAMVRIQALMREQLLRLDAGLALPF